MKEKITTVLLTIIAIFAPVLILPTTEYNILKYALLLIVGVFLLIMILANYKNIEIDKKDILILCFLGLAYISMLLSGNIMRCLFGESNRFEGFIMFCIYTCIYMSSKKFFNFKNIKIFLNIMFYISMAIGILGILQKYITLPKLYPIFNKGICRNIWQL